MAQLTIKNLAKTFKDKVAVNNLSMNIDAGEFVAFLGPNGAGKSTTVGMLTRLTQPTSGEIIIDGLKPSSTKYRQNMGVVFQYGVLDDALSVSDNLKLRAKMYVNTDSRWLQRLIDDFGLSSIINQKYGSLSGGQRRRVDIARELINQPHILILDEPSTGLDIQTREVIWQTIHQIRHELKMTVILTTHYLEEAETADFVYIIDHGSIIAADTVDNLKHQYANYEINIKTDNGNQLIQQLQADGYVVENNTSSGELSLAVNDAQESIDVLVKYRQLIEQFDCHEGDMNTIFLALTGKEIR